MRDHWQWPKDLGWFHLGSHWRIGSDETGRSFTARFWGISWSRSLDRPTRGLFYMSSDRGPVRPASDGDSFFPQREPS